VRGIRVLDMTRVLAGPWATQMMADQGAEVIKVESPQGDETRRFEPRVGDDATYFQSLNRNKRSIVLDLKTASGRAVLQRLAASSDVVVENFRPGVAARVGLEWPTLHASFPRLVYVAIHAFGDGESEGTDRAGYDLVLQAMGGAASFTGFPDSPPVRSGLPVADLLSGLYATQAALLGLLEVERTGRGQKIVVNMLQAQAAALTYQASRYVLTGEEEAPRGSAHRGLVPYNLYPCSGGHIAIACGNDGMWQRLREAVRMEDRVQWRTNAGRVDDREALEQALCSAVAEVAVSELDARLCAAGVAAGPVLTIGQVLGHEAVSHVALRHPRLGEFQLPAPVLQTASTRAEHRCAPELGEHRDALLNELGYGQDSLDELERQGAFG